MDCCPALSCRPCITPRAHRADEIPHTRRQERAAASLTPTPSTKTLSFQLEAFLDGILIRTYDLISARSAEAPLEGTLMAGIPPGAWRNCSRGYSAASRRPRSATDR